MSFHFDLPNFSVGTPGEKRMYAYLYQTVQQLNWAMEHLNTAPAAQIPATVAYSAGKKVSEAQAQENFNQIKGLIIRSADIVNAYCQQIEKTLRGSFLARSEFGDYARDTELTLQANSQAITQNFTNLQQLKVSATGISDQVSSLDARLETASDSLSRVEGRLQQEEQTQKELSGAMDALTTRILQTDAYIKTGVIDTDPEGNSVYGLEIGQTNAVGGQEVFNKYARFSSSRLSFYDRNDTEVAYISDYKLYITNVQITGQLALGGFVLDTTDGLAFRYLEQEA